MPLPPSIRKEVSIMAIDQGLLLKVKNSIRISHTALDEDIQDTISACFADLQVCGITASTVDVDPLILNAIKLYCKASYTDDPVKAARYQVGYDALKSCLQMAEGYGWEESTNE